MLKRAGLARDVEQVNIDDVAGLLEDGMTGCRVDLDGGFEAFREACDLVIAVRMPEQARYAPVALAVPGNTRAAGGVFFCVLFDGIPLVYRDHPPGEQYFDFDAFPLDTVARGRLPGDRFHPLGAPGGKKLKGYLIDRKLSRWYRDSLPLLASGGDIIWVVGQTIADGVKITKKTRRVLKIAYSAGEDGK